MMRPTLTQSCLWMRKWFTFAAVFLSSMQLFAQNVSYGACMCSNETTDGCLTTTVVIDDAIPGHTYVLDDAVNFFYGCDDPWAFPDGTAFAQTGPTTFELTGFSDGNILPTAVIHGLDENGTQVFTVPLFTNCVSTNYAITSSAAETCVGSDVNLSFAVTPAPRTAQSFLWTASPSACVTFNDPTLAAPTVSFSCPGVYAIILGGTDNHTQCPIEEVVMITVTEYPASISGTTYACIQPGSADVTLSYSLTTAGSPGDVGLTWTATGGATPSAASAYTTDFTFPAAGTYTLTATGTGPAPESCPFSVDYEVEIVDDVPIGFSRSDTYLCANEEYTYILDFTSETSDGNSAAWSLNGTALPGAINDATQYTINNATAGLVSPGMNTLVATGLLLNGCSYRAELVFEIDDNTNGSIACNNQVNLSMNDNCLLQVTADMILEGLNINSDAYDIVLTDENDVVVPNNMVDDSYLGQLLQVMVIHQCSGNSCWGHILVEDKTIPNLSSYCQNPSVLSATCEELQEDASTLGMPIFPADVTVTYQGNNVWSLDGYDNCGLATLTFVDDADYDCTDLIINITRTWIASDENSNGSTSTCVVPIIVLQPTAGDIIWPPNYDDVLPSATYPSLHPCDGGATDTDGLDVDEWIENDDHTPSTESTGEPVIPICGQRFDHFHYTDKIIPICGSDDDPSYKLLRTWSVRDVCDNVQVEHTQIITVMDGDPLQCVAPTESVVYADKHLCRIDVLEFPGRDEFEFVDVCDKNYSVTVSYKVRDPETGIIPDEFTSLPVNTFTAYDVEINSDSIWVFYYLRDNCGNEGECFTEIAVIDTEQPTAVCDLNSTITLNPNDGCAYAGPETFDDFSHDNCGVWEKVIRRMDTDGNPCGCEDHYPHFRFADYLGAYNGHHYYLSHEPISGPRAFPWAYAVGAYPVTLNSAAENTWVNDQVREIMSGPFLIGYSASPGMGVPNASDYEWSNGENDSYTNWGTSQPFSGEPGLDYYVVADIDGNWNANSSDQISARYVFELEDPCGWTQKIKFCCEDIREPGEEPLMVQMRVIDNYGNHNFCMVELDVQDKQGPSITAPGDITIDCDDTVTIGPSDTEVTVVEDGIATIYSAVTESLCGFVLKMKIQEPTLNCGTGVYTVIWEDEDLTISEEMKIYVVDQNPFDGDVDANFPDDLEINASSSSICDISSLSPQDLEDEFGERYGFPSWLEAAESCGSVTSSHKDEVFYWVDDACMKVVRTWTVIDWCQNGEYWTGVQVIKLFDNAGPQLSSASCSSVEIEGPAYGPNCWIDGDAIVAEATDNCTEVDDLVWSWEIDYDGGGSNSGSDNSVEGPFPQGMHTIVWTVEDHCGNISTCDLSVEVTDNKAPVAYCLDLVVISIDPHDSTAVIWAKDLAVPSDDYCNGVLDYSFSSTDLDDISRTFDCGMLGDGVLDTFFVDVYFTDASGNQSSCNTGVIVQDNQNVCPDVNPVGSRGDIGGMVYTEDNVMVENVEITASNSAPEFPKVELTENGEYVFPNIEMYSDYQIGAFKDDDYLNGVSTLDIVLIQKHILGLQALDSPYKIIAADVNNNQSVSAVDLIELRKLILGIYNDLPDTDSWRFVEEDFVFANPSSPWPFSEEISVDNMTQSFSNLDFIGVKIGDVNRTADPTRLNDSDPVISFRSGLSFDVSLNQTTDVSGNTVVEFIAAQDINLIGTQFALELLTEGAIKEVNSRTLGFESKNWNEAMLDNGMVVVSWNKQRAQRIINGDVLFAVTMDKAHASDIKFNVVNDQFATEVYEEVDGQINILDLNINNNISDEDGFEVYQNKPNPFTNETTIGFNLGEDDQVLLQVIDYTGRVLYTELRQFEKGYNEYVIGSQVLQTSGMLYYQLSTETKTVSKKMVVLD